MSEATDCHRPLRRMASTGLFEIVVLLYYALIQLVSSLTLTAMDGGNWIWDIPATGNTDIFGIGMSIILASSHKRFDGVFKTPANVLFILLILFVLLCGVHYGLTAIAAPSTFNPHYSPIYDFFIIVTGLVAGYFVAKIRRFRS